MLNFGFFQMGTTACPFHFQPDSCRSVKLFGISRTDQRTFYGLAAGKKAGKVPLFVQDKTETSVAVEVVLMALVCLDLSKWIWIR